MAELSNSANYQSTNQPDRKIIGVDKLFESENNWVGELSEATNYSISLNIQYTHTTELAANRIFDF